MEPWADFNADQRREMVNSRQLFAALKQAYAQRKHSAGSMVWSATKGIDYLLRSWQPSPGQRRQRSLGPRSDKTEAIKRAFDEGRAEAEARLADLKIKLARQSAINRVLGLGRVPLMAARILRAIDEAGLADGPLTLVGTHALYAYEAAAGVMIDRAVTATEDVDLLFDSRAGLRFAAASEAPTDNLLRLLKRIDHSFDAPPGSFRAVNRDGYMVDLIKPLRHPPERADRDRLVEGAHDLIAVEIEGLLWLENAPRFEAVAIDEKGQPLRLSTIDPRVFALHKLWVSRQPSRDPVQRRRDAMQASAVARLVDAEFAHLPFDGDALRMLPRALVEEGRALFAAVSPAHHSREQ